MLYFVRHGESENNVRRIFSGQRNNPDLTSTGEVQARKVGQEIIDQKITINKIVSSPLKRALRTAELIAQVIEFDKENIKVDDRFAEYDMGDMSGKPVYKITSKEMISARGAEDPQDFMDRIIAGLKEYSSDKENILIVSHAAVGRMIRAYKEKVGVKDFYDLDRPPNGKLIELGTF